jgi:hypothetical protein
VDVFLFDGVKQFRALIGRPVPKWRNRGFEGERLQVDVKGQVISHQIKKLHYGGARQFADDSSR